MTLKFWNILFMSLNSHTSLHRRPILTTYIFLIVPAFFSLSKMLSRFTMYSMYQYFIPFYSWMLYYMDMLYIVYPGSPADGHLSFFYFLAIMNSVIWTITFSLRQTLSIIIIQINRLRYSDSLGMKQLHESNANFISPRFTRIFYFY